MLKVLLTVLKWLLFCLFQRHILVCHLIFFFLSPLVKSIQPWILETSCVPPLSMALIKERRRGHL